MKRKRIVDFFGDFGVCGKPKNPKNLQIHKSKLIVNPLNSMGEPLNSGLILEHGRFLDFLANSVRIFFFFHIGIWAENNKFIVMAVSTFKSNHLPNELL